VSILDRRAGDDLDLDPDLELASWASPDRETPLYGWMDGWMGG
jgi:hypothetical protein